MKIAINDLSFFKCFPSKQTATEAMENFCYVLDFLKNEKISGVKVPADIVNSPDINLTIPMTEECRLSDVLKELKKRDWEKYMFLLTILTARGLTEDEEETVDEFFFQEMSSRHCARYREDFLISLVHEDAFNEPVIQGTMKGKGQVSIRNLAEELHIYQYWEELGFRLYERNRKHGNRIYARKNGMIVGVAPRTDELGQKLLNMSIAFKGKIYSIDMEDGASIYEFPNTERNIFHGFKRDDLTEDVQNKIRKIWEQKNNAH